jgi:predicted short-subunit dehydrogenase-like oxidoreductase (DUF2520 family)
MKTFSIIGAGRLGTSLGAALSKKGWDLKVIADRDPAAARESRKIIGRGRATTDIAEAGRGVRVLFLCVPDDALEAAARKLARSEQDWAGRLVLHTSGLHTSAALAPLRKRGARAASLHPAQSFPRKGGSPRLFRGIVWGIEGDAEAIAAGRDVVKALGGRALILRPENKALYHAACCLASNSLVALEAASETLLRAAGVPAGTADALLRSLVQETLRNVKKLGPRKALTGPVVRGDIGTVRRHLEALKAYPGQKEAYQAVGKLALELVGGEAVPAGRIRALRRLLRGK